CLQGYTNPLTF
nr:immunoglobulin light chain junction region [Macaca mulatta]